MSFAVVAGWHCDGPWADELSDEQEGRVPGGDDAVGLRVRRRALEGGDPADRSESLTVSSARGRVKRSMLTE